MRNSMVFMAIFFIGGFIILQFAKLKKNLDNIFGHERIIIEKVYPQIDEGAFPIKRVVGENVIVRSIHPGVVVYTDYLPGVGNLVFIDHGMSYYSLYGHCSDFLVKKGSVVTTGQPIAYVGDIGSMKGNTLHFEIRNKTTPLNPLQWLKRR